MIVIGAAYMLLLQTGLWYNSDFSLHFPINIVNHTKGGYLIKPLLNISELFCFNPHTLCLFSTIYLPLSVSSVLYNILITLIIFIAFP